MATGIFEVSRAKVGIVSEVDVGACGEAGAGVFGEGVKCESVYDDGGDLEVLDGQ
jgi:hypothetical protein